MKPPRFTLRFLLVVVTITTLGLWLWRMNYGPRSIAAADIQSIDVGMNEWQVRYYLGPPHQVVDEPRKTWLYDVQGTVFRFHVLFEGGRVSLAGKHVHVR